MFAKFPKWLCLVVAVVAVCSVVQPLPQRLRRASELLYSHYGPGAHCEVDGRLISHGQVFTVPTMSRCLQHQCFFGSTFIFSEGCEDGNGGCHEVGEAWQERCITYTCTKTTIGGYNYFQPIVQEARCQDVNRHCHAPGEPFSYRLHGRLHHSCRCNITDNRIYYRCY